MKLVLCVTLQVFILSLNFAMFYAIGFVYDNIEHVSLYALPSSVFFAWEVLYVYIVLKIYGEKL